VGRERRQVPQEASPRRRLAQATEQKGPGRQVAAKAESTHGTPCVGDGHGHDPADRGSPVERWFQSFLPEALRILRQAAPNAAECATASAEEAGSGKVELPALFTPLSHFSTARTCARPPNPAHWLGTCPTLPFHLGGKVVAFLIQALSLYGRYFAAVVLIGLTLGLGILLTSWLKNR